MEIFKGIRTKIANKRLDKEHGVARDHKGSTLLKSKSFAILYKDTDEQRYTEIKAYVEQLKKEFGITDIKAYAYVDREEKNLPSWQIKHKEFDFFFRKNVKWNMQPSVGVTGFTNQEFDILIDLSRDECLPVSFVLARSKAKMKVGRVDSTSAKFYDLLIDVDENISLKDYLNKVNYYLTKFNFE